jgi:hypothetical protein
MVGNANVSIFAGSGGHAFAERMCRYLGCPLGDSSVIRFSDGNTFVRINESVRDRAVYLVQPIGMSPNDEFVEILFWLDAFKRASCMSATLVMPYFGYAKGDKKYILWIETVWGNAKTFTVIALFYYFFGLDGLGYGALCSAVVDVIVSIILTRWRYGFQLSAPALRLLTVMLTLAAACFMATFITSTSLSYAIMSLATGTCIAYSLIGLNRRLDLRAIAQRLRKKGHANE